MGTTTLSTLIQRLSEQLGDWLQEDTSTLVKSSSASFLCTDLNKWDDGQDGYFNTWWAYFTEGNNSGTERKIYDYVTASGLVSVRGGNLSAETSQITVDFHRYQREYYKKAINDAIREIYPALHRKIEARSLTTGNILPPEDWWPTTSTLKFYSQQGTSASIDQSTGSGLYYGELGSRAIKFTAGAGTTDDYLYISAKDYPRLLDLMDRSVDFKSWIYTNCTRSTASNEPWLQIYTKNSTGGEQTLPSTTASHDALSSECWNLLELESQSLNDDLTDVQIRFRVNPKGKYIILDKPRVVGKHLYEYMLPYNFQNGELHQVWIQTSGYSDDPCDDIQPRTWERVYGYSVKDDGTYKWIRMPFLPSNNRQIWLIGTAPLSTLSSDTDTVEIDGERINLLVALAKYKFYQQLSEPAGAQDVSRYKNALAEAYGEYLRLLRSHRMPMPSGTMKLP